MPGYLLCYEQGSSSGAMSHHVCVQHILYEIAVHGFDRRGGGLCLDGHLGDISVTLSGPRAKVPDRIGRAGIFGPYI